MADANLQIREALNRHGVFLKKAVIEQLPVQELKIHEEIGSSFGGTRVADIVAIEHFVDATLYLVLECKRVAEDRRWIFFRHKDRSVRVARKVGLNRRSDFRQEQMPCSEGFEYPLRDRNESPIADNDPVSKAATQLSAAYLGIAQDRWVNRAGGLPDKGEFFVPILVTTARLSVVLNLFDAAPVTTGRLTDDLKLQDVSELVLKHPFPTPAGFDEDFRRKATEPWHQRFTECIHVVQATHLAAFLEPGRRASFVIRQG